MCKLTTENTANGNWAWLNTYMKNMRCAIIHESWALAQQVTFRSRLQEFRAAESYPCDLETLEGSISTLLCFSGRQSCPGRSGDPGRTQRSMPPSFCNQKVRTTSLSFVTLGYMINQLIASVIETARNGWFEAIYTLRARRASFKTTEIFVLQRQNVTREGS